MGMSYSVIDGLVIIKNEYHSNIIVDRLQDCGPVRRVLKQLVSNYDMTSVLGGLAAPPQR